MKALSLKQPWAQLCVIGAKQYETRGWQTFHRGTLLIHASKNRIEAALLCLAPHFRTFVKDYHKLSYGAIIGEVKLVECFQTEIVRDKLSEQEKEFGDYSNGRWAWQFTDPVIYKNAIPYKGSLSVWEFPDELLLMAHKLIK